MEELSSQLRPQKSAWFSLISIMMMVLAGFVFIGPFIGLFLALPFYEGSMFDFMNDVSDPSHHPEIKMPLYIMQGCATLIGLVIIPAFYIRTIEKNSVLTFFKNKKNYGQVLVLTFLLVMSFFGINAMIIEWNANLNFPEFLKGFETWAKEKELMAEQHTAMLTNFSNVGEFIIAAVSHITQKRITGRVDMIRYGIVCDGYVFYAAGSTGGFGKINRLSLP